MFVVESCVELNIETCQTETEQMTFIGKKKKMQRHRAVYDSNAYAILKKTTLRKMLCQRIEAKERSKKDHTLVHSLSPVMAMLQINN